MYDNPCSLCHSTLQRTVGSLLSRLGGDCVAAEAWALNARPEPQNHLISFRRSNKIHTVFKFLCFKTFCCVAAVDNLYDSSDGFVYIFLRASRAD